MSNLYDSNIIVMDSNLNDSNVINVTSNLYDANIITMDSNLNDSNVLLAMTSNLYDPSIITINSNLDYSNLYDSNMPYPIYDNTVYSNVLNIEPIKELTPLEKFNRDFSVLISKVNIPHREDSGLIGFVLKCNKNQNTKYFEIDVETSNICNACPYSILDLAWSNLQPSITCWSSNAINDESIFSKPFYPSADNLNFGTEIYDVAEFNNNLHVNITQYTPFPIVNPDSWMIAFEINDKKVRSNKKSFISRLMIDDFSIEYSVEELLDMAWTNCKQKIYEWIKLKIGKFNMLGNNYIPKAI